jgi:hypothetical protein
MAEPLRLGPGPSLLGDDPASQIQAAGFEVSDFNGAFTDGAVFQSTPHFKALGPLMVMRAGSIEVGGTLAVFDPLDADERHRTFAFQRAVPAGRHDVFLSKHGGAVIASLVRFKDAPAVSWSPALFAGTPVCPRPPLLPMFQTRCCVSYADADAAESGELPEEVQAGIEAMRRESRTVDEREGFVAWDVGGAGQYASWFGQDEHGELVALATEYGRLRQPVVESVRIVVRDALARATTLEEGATLRAKQQEEGFQIWLRPDAPSRMEKLYIEARHQREREEPSSIAREGRTTVYRFLGRPAAADVIRVDLIGVSRPLLHLDPASVARKLERWRAQELLAVELDSIPVLARRFCEDAAGRHVSDWLAEQDEVEDLFF